MLDINQIESFYPENLRSFKRNMLREYIQYKIIETIFTSSFAPGLAFMGGTAIRIVHGGTRFSEDLDFDNINLSRENLEELSLIIRKRLALEGYEPEEKNSFRLAFRSSIRISRILQKAGISGHRDELLTIQVDAEPQNFEYEPQSLIINKFDVFGRIRVVPVDILLSQKICCMFTRKRPMGRDFHDIIFLMARTQPNLSYLRDKLGITSGEVLKKEILLRCKDLNFSHLSRDVAPFLMNHEDAYKILSFREYVEDLEFTV